MNNKIKIYQYDNKFYIQTADSKIYEYNKDTKELSETFSKKEFGVAFYNGEIKIGKEDWKDLTAAALSMEGVKFSEKGKLAQQFDKEYKQAETGIRAFDSENINRRSVPNKEQKEYETPDLVYSTDRDTGIMRADVSYQGKSIARFNGQGMDTMADIRGDEGEGPTGEHGKYANDINNNDWVPEDIAEMHGLDDEHHGDMKTPEQEKEKYTIKDLPKEVPVFYSPIIEDREEEIYDPDDPTFADPRWSN